MPFSDEEESDDNASLIPRKRKFSITGLPPSKKMKEKLMHRSISKAEAPKHDLLRSRGIIDEANCDLKLKLSGDILILSSKESEDIGSLFTANEKAEWSEIYSIGMTPCYASLVIVASHNWMPSTHSNHVSEPRAKLIYKLSTGVELILMQAPLPLLDDDVLIRPLHYQKDKRSGKEYIKARR
ncbi:unnamed protein product [Microthlaspi erraticum]|uniref:Uncharacterized protein n=1 Tax=Microthlaspi erraticum TaxID=1685480 RepID=A0A6D2I0H8_9BRAS|nr:unnamed protein product [Microthlaspi erraticum]